MKDADCVQFLQAVLPRMRMRWPGFRKVRRQVCKRVDRRIRYLGLEHVAAYQEFLDRHPAEWSVLDGLCRISISRFYRDRGVFDLLREEVLPRLAKVAEKRDHPAIEVWSAGCASGEEVYTLKLLWEIAVQRQFPDVSLHITATDADLHLLQRARRGVYQPSSIKDFPQDWITVAFTRQGEDFSVRSVFRGGLDFLCQDIRQQQPDGPFDLILCRHLAFTYFDGELQEEILRKILLRLRPAGILMSGKQETLPAVAWDELCPFAPHSGLYRRKGGPP